MDIAEDREYFIIIGHLQDIAIAILRDPQAPFKEKAVYNKNLEIKNLKYIKSEATRPCQEEGEVAATISHKQGNTTISIKVAMPNTIIKDIKTQIISKEAVKKDMQTMVVCRNLA